MFFLSLVILPGLMLIGQTGQTKTLDNIGLPENWKDPGYAKLVWVDSPNCGDRPLGTVIDTIVLHHTGNKSLGSVVKWFSTKDSQVSAHFTIGKDGSIVQHVSTFRRAWHVGVSRDFLGRENVNNFSIGIEMVNAGDGIDPWTKDQVQVLKFLILHLRKRFPELKYITSHEFVAVPRGRKNDPLNFPWTDLKDLGLELVYDMSKRKDPPPMDMLLKPLASDRFNFFDVTLPPKMEAVETMPLPQLMQRPDPGL